MTINLGGFADGLSKIGKNLMETATFYGASKMALHNPSTGMYGPSVWTQGCYGGGYMGGGYMGGMYSPYNNAAIGMAYQNGYASTMAAIQSAIAGSQPVADLPDTDAPAASAVDANQDTMAGAAFEVSEKTGQNFDFAKTSLESITDAAQKQAKYNELTQQLAKSLLMNIDKNSGNSDGYLALDEFLNNELKNSNLSEEQKTQLRTKLQQAYSQLDQNGDSKVDWKELTAMITGLYDTNNDGEITAEEFQAGGNNLLSGSGASALRTAYQNLFGNREQS